MSKDYIKLGDLEIYKLSRALSQTAWIIFQDLDFQNKKIIGDQFVRATDSVAANIAEGYGRYHYLDKIKFMYIARGSLTESKHWFEVIAERNVVKEGAGHDYKKIYPALESKLNAFIATVYRTKRTSAS